ncbi:p21-activated protein kinase-interacting protein 1-like protein [Actinomortierella ambigua]|nr:p21-activated protein kinase-interacting protein 1-like protein [Actinomortierella ambigua]
MGKNKQLKSAMKKQPSTGGAASSSTASQQKNANKKRPAPQQTQFKDSKKNNHPATSHTTKKPKLDTTTTPKKSVKIVAPKPAANSTNPNRNKPAKKPKVKKAEVVPENATKEDFRIVTGTYQNVLYGIDAYWNEDKTLKMKPVFAFSAHIGCIKSLAIGGSTLASGSTDEKIQLYDLKRRKELGALMQHTGTITTLAFHQHTHMLSGSDDGKICVWRSKDWECLKIMKGHQSSVHSIAIHPSGKLALSVSADKTMRLWNLLLGKQASQNRLSHAGLQIAWNPSGARYAILFDHEIALYDMATAKPLCAIQPPPLTPGSSRKTRFNTMAYYTDDYVVAGCEDKTLRIYATETGELVCTLTGHPSRIKDIDLLRNILVTPNKDANSTADAQSAESVDLLVSASSDGLVRVWDIGKAVAQGRDSDAAIQPLGEHNTEMRVTCLSTQPGIWKNINTHRAASADENEDDEEEEEEDELEDSEQESEEEDEDEDVFDSEEDDDEE